MVEKDRFARFLVLAILGLTVATWDKTDAQAQAIKLPNICYSASVLPPSISCVPGLDLLIPGKPTSLTASDGTSADYVQLSWGAAPKAEYYSISSVDLECLKTNPPPVYLANSLSMTDPAWDYPNNMLSNFPCRKAVATKITSVSYRDYSALPGRHYSYVVIAGNKASEKYAYFSFGVSNADEGWRALSTTPTPIPTPVPNACISGAALGTLSVDNCCKLNVAVSAQTASSFKCRSDQNNTKTRGTLALLKVEEVKKGKPKKTSAVKMTIAVNAAGGAAGASAGTYIVYREAIAADGTVSGWTPVAMIDQVVETKFGKAAKYIAPKFRVKDLSGDYTLRSLWKKPFSTAKLTITDKLLSLANNDKMKNAVGYAYDVVLVAHESFGEVSKAETGVFVTGKAQSTNAGHPLD